MIWTSISDIHIKPNDESSQEILIEFLKKSSSLKAEKVFLLGDIFDLMVGSHDEYLDQYPEIFGAIAKGQKEGQSFYFFEGNHDFHLKELWNSFSMRFQTPEVHYVENELLLNFDNKKILFSHGDNSSKENVDYKLYKGFIRSGFIKQLSTNVVPYKIVDSIGVWASKKSRKYSSSYEIKQEIKDKYREIASYEAGRFQADIVISGHSHIEDYYEFSNKVYINNGMSLRTKKFVKIENGLPVLEQL
jgi:UDP-2,3-diacylglucosamine hydrolase